MRASRRIALLGAGAGLAAGAAGVGAGELTAAALPGDSSPVTAVGDWVIDRTPLPLKNFAIETFGDADKDVLIGSVVVVLALLVAAAGAAGVRSRRIGIAVFVALAAIDGVLVAIGRTSTARDLVAVGVLAAVGVGALVWLLSVLAPLVRAPRPEPAPGDAEPVTLDRRRFLVSATAVGAAGVLGGGAAQLVGASATGRSAVDLPAVSAPAAAGPVPAGADFGIDGLTPYLTPLDDFYKVDISLRSPRLDVRTWRLPIRGRVAEPIDLTFDDLLDMRLVERRITLACVSNPVGGSYTGNATWLGVPIADVLERVGLDPTADAVMSTGADGITIGTPLSALTDGRDALFAVGMNGEPLPIDHGFPVRMVVPGLYGFVSATKWLTGFEVTRFEDFEAYWTPRGWSEQAVIKTQSRIDLPTGGDTVAPGSVTVAGVAWAQHRGISRVEVQIDGGAWQEAELAVEDTPDAWRQWRLTWEADPGEHVIVVRATDGDGKTQTPVVAEPAPDGATGWHSRTITVG